MWTGGIGSDQDQTVSDRRTSGRRQGDVREQPGLQGTLMGQTEVKRDLHMV